jgi:hypothetical protein
LRKLATPITLALLALVLGPASSASATPREFFGVAPFDDPTQAEFNRMGDGRVGTLRTNFLWPAVQALGPIYFDWSRYDTLVGRAAENGIRVLPTVYGSPGWAAKKSRFPPNPQHVDEFEEFMRQAAERYGPGGTFWTLNPLLPETPIIDWQIWNEVNSPIFWLPRPNAKQYKPILAAAERAIHDVNPDSRIVLAGLFPTPMVKHGVFMDAYLRQLYRIRGRSLFDAMAVHPYALTPRQALETVDEARAVLRRHGDAQKPIWITEVGWASSGLHTPLTVGAKTQARYLTQTFRKAARSRIRRRIAGVIWFSFKDQRPRHWSYRTGLFTRAGKAKPSWKAFVRATGGSP